MSGADRPQSLGTPPRDRTRSRRPATMTMYRLYLLGPTGRIEAVQRFSADAEKQAVALGRRYMTSDSWFGGFELWVDSRRVHLETRKRRQRNGRLPKRKTTQHGPGE